MKRKRRRKVHFRPNDTYSDIACGRRVSGWIDYLETTSLWVKVTCKDCLKKRLGLLYGQPPARADLEDKTDETIPANNGD